MAKQVKWDEYEAALLLDACVRVEQGTLAKKDAIRSVSQALRQRARDRGLEIDEVYRNENGISWQLWNMQIETKNYLSQSKECNSKMFRHVIELYYEDRDSFSTLLSEIKGENIKVKSKKDLFAEWLLNKVSSNRLSEYFIAVTELENYAKRKNIISGSIWDVESSEKVKEIENTLVADKFFCFLHKKTVYNMKATVSLLFEYFEYTKEKENCAKIAAEQVKEDSITLPEITVKEPEKKAEQKEIPSEPEPEKTEDNAVIEEPSEQTVDFQNLADFAFTKPISISYFGDEFQEDSWRRIYTRACRCLIEDYPEVFKTLRKDTVIGGKNHQIYNQGMSVHLIAPAKIADNYYVETNKNAGALLLSLRKLIDVCNVDYENVMIQYQKIKKTETEDVTTPQADTSNVPVLPAKDDTDIERLAEILKASFPDGFRPGSVIDRNRLRLYYADSFGEELKKSDEEINVILGRIGSLQDGRIYVRDAEAQSRLIDTILADVDSVMKKGAASVHYSELYERYKQELAEQLKIYSPDVMVEELRKVSHGAYRFGSRCIFAYGEGRSLNREVQSVMKNSQRPLSFAELHEILWYIPIDLIKSAVRMSPRVVNVAANTYFYAPNIPISREELQAIAQLISGELSQKAFIKDKALRKLIYERIPSVAINTGDFTERGFRNCLAVLLGNQFSFKGTVISPKGQSLDSSRMYIDYCRSRESMSLDELKAFSAEINAPINWSSVMMTMVRISKDEFIRKGSISFDAEATDRVLSELFEGEYMPLKDFKLFLHYPPIGIKWNKYVLESYVYEYSHRFFLLHTSFSESECCGAVVRQGSSIKDMRGLVLDVLSHSDEWNTAGEAISLLVSKGYIQRRSFSGIDEIVHVAGLQRKRIKENSER